MLRDNLFKLFLATLLLILSLGCKPTQRSFEYFLLHPQDIQTAFGNCNKESELTAPSKECEAMLQAIPIINHYLKEISQGNHYFGLRIMEAQLRLMELKKAQMAELSRADRDVEKIKKLQEALENQDLIIQSRYAFLRYIRQRHS